MHRRFVVSDHHFVQPSIYTFTTKSGARIRPWASDDVEGDALMIDAHNKAVGKGDTTYFLGDVAMRAIGLKNLGRMNGRKVLIRGNHDIFRMKQYTEYFADIRGTHKIGRLILSHYPIHRASIPRWCQANVHGHTHAHLVQRRLWWGKRVVDPLYVNVCVEHLPGLMPIDIEEIAARFQKDA
jgi:calcineurin-like phosphoesterase family protein